MPEDLYAYLEVPRSASDAEIRKAYLKLARTHHPDKGGNPEHFKRIQKAYDVLSDTKAKDFYDHTGQVMGENEGGGSGPFGGGMPFPGGMPFGPGAGFGFNMEDLFGMFGGGGPNRRGPGGPRHGRHPGKPPAKHSQIPLTLHDFYYGRTLEIRLERQRFCAGCKGEGSKSSSACGACNGQGVRARMVQMGPMMAHTVGPCTDCMGSGKKPGPPCSDCNGGKFKKEEKVLHLVITPGMKPGDTVLFTEESSHQEEFELAADLLFELQAAEEETTWERDGSNLFCDVTLHLAQALCGTTITMGMHPGFPHGFCFEVPACTMNGDKIHIKNAGMPKNNEGNEKGDVYIRIHVVPRTDEIEICRNRSIQDIFQFVPSLPSVQPVWKGVA